MKADERADCAVLCLAWQGTGLRNRRYHRPSLPTTHLKQLGVQLVGYWQLQLKYRVEDTVFYLKHGVGTYKVLVYSR